MLTEELLEEAKKVENNLIENCDLLEDGRRNNDTINILIVSYILGYDWTHGYEIISSNVELNVLGNDDLAWMSDTYQEFVNDKIDRPYSRLEWVENIISNNPNNWEEVLISKLM